jgi:hypothetical protein
MTIAVVDLFEQVGINEGYADASRISPPSDVTLEVRRVGYAVVLRVV